MPQEQMSEQQVAAYVHMDAREVHKLASRGQIPCRKVKGEFVFRKGQVDHWVEAQMHRLDKGRLEGIEKGVSAHHGMKTEGMLVGPMIPAGGVVYPLKGTSRDAVVRSLVKLADSKGLVFSAEALVAEIKSREELCSTALAPGVALPHPRHPLPYDIQQSFVVVGLTASGVPYGAADGSLTRLFFLICCKDDRTHLHVLARIGRMLQDQESVDTLLAAESSQELTDKLRELEEQIGEEA